MIDAVYLPLQNDARIYLKRLAWKLLSLVPRETTLSTHNGVLTISTRDRVLGKALFSTGNYEWNTILTVMNALRRDFSFDGKLMLDIGANIGMISIACVRHGLFGKALAFEPEAYNFSLLQRNVIQNGLSSSIDCYNLALSSVNGTFEMELCADNFGDHRLRLGGGSTPGFYHEEERTTRPVKAIRLDDFWQDCPGARESIGLIWVDIQGHEGHFLSGARNTIGKGAPVVLEFWPYAMMRAGTSREEFVKLAQEMFNGYFRINSFQSSAPRFTPIGSLDTLFDEYRRPREMGTLLFV